MFIPETVAPVSSITPTSLFGWGGFIFGLIACSILIYEKILGKGKSLKEIDSKIDGLCKSVEAIKKSQAEENEQIDKVRQGFRDFIVEWKGLDGENGWRSVIRQHSKELHQIIRRNTRIDAVRERDERESGGLRRRKMDEVLGVDDLEDSQ